MRTVKILLAGFSLAVLVGCAAAPKVMTSARYLGDMRAATLFQANGEKLDDLVLYNYILRVCNIDASGNESNCADSVILENVIR